MTKVSATTHKRSSYSSESMARRRTRVLEEARALIAEAGYDGVTMRLLAERSEVASATLYNIYGNKETLVATAVAELFEEQLEEGAEYAQQGEGGIEDALDSALRRLDWFAREIMRMPEYARAMVIVFFSGSPESMVRDLLRNMSSASYRRLLEQLARHDGIAPWADINLLADEMSHREFAVVHDWAIGRVPPEKLAGRQKYALLLTVGAVAVGSTLAAVHARLEACQKALA
jgi:AcrR family transcriptional regulator